MGQKLKNFWDEDGYLILFNEMNDVKGRWNLTKESFHRILDIFELKEKKVKYDLFRFVVYSTISTWIFYRFLFFIDLLQRHSKNLKQEYHPYKEDNFSINLLKTVLLQSKFKLENKKINLPNNPNQSIPFFLDKGLSNITLVVSFSYILEFLFWDVLHFMLVLFLDLSNLNLNYELSKKTNLEVNANSYGRMLEAVSKFLEKPFLNLTVQEFDEIQKAVVLKNNFSAEWLEAISGDLKSFIAETLGNIYIRSFIQGSMDPKGVEQMNHFFLQKGILQHIGIPWEEKDYLLLLWDRMLTTKPSDYYKAKYPDRIVYEKFQEKSEYMFPGETLEFIKYADTADLNFSFVNINQSKLDEWRFFLNRTKSPEKDNLNLILNFKLNDSFDEQLSQFIAHTQHPEILADLILGNIDELPLLSIRHLPDFINWERYDEIFDEFD